MWSSNPKPPFQSLIFEPALKCPARWSTLSCQEDNCVLQKPGNLLDVSAALEERSVGKDGLYDIYECASGVCDG